jgi:hypothetical protein
MRCNSALKERVESKRSKGVAEVAARRLAQSRLHVAAAHWGALEVVMRCNSPVCPLDCILSQWGCWSGAVKTL